MKDKSIIIISGLIDANIKAYQPDTDFYIYKTIDGLAAEIEKIPIRAQTLFMTRDVIGQSNQAFIYLYGLLNNDNYLSVDSVVYITEKDSPELQSIEYLIEEHDIQNWEIIQGGLTKAYVTEIINGTARTNTFNVKHKAAYRTPKSAYVRAKMKEHSSLDEEYVDDDNDLAEIPDVEIPDIPIVQKENILEKIHIVGEECEERTAFSYLAAQYLSLIGKTIIVESDVEFHQLTEFATKSGVEYTFITITELYEDASLVVERIRKAETSLVVLGCIDRIEYNYDYIINLLYYNLLHDFRYIIVESDFAEMPNNTNNTVVVPDNVIGCLKVGEQVDKNQLEFINFVGVDLAKLPQISLPSSTVITKILQDVLTDSRLKCPVVRIESLKLNGTAYDLGSVLGRRMVQLYN